MHLEGEYRDTKVGHCGLFWNFMAMYSSCVRILRAVKLGPSDLIIRSILGKLRCVPTEKKVWHFGMFSAVHDS